jgi:hypothetical protein
MWSLWYGYDMICPQEHIDSLFLDCNISEVYTAKLQIDHEGNTTEWPIDDQILLQVYCQDGIVLLVKASR